jgi:hypothetical protein
MAHGSLDRSELRRVSSPREGRQHDARRDFWHQAALLLFTDKVLAAARPAGQEGGLGTDVRLRDAIAVAEGSIAAGFADQPTVEAAIRHTLGRSYFVLGEPAKAIRQQEHVRALPVAALGPEHPDAMGTGQRLLARRPDRRGDPPV